MKNSKENLTDDEVYYQDLVNLPPDEFFAKYHHDDHVNTTISHQDQDRQDRDHDDEVDLPYKSETDCRQFISTDVMCYIIMAYLDWKTIFTNCLLVNKEFYRRIANNRQLFIQLFNQLFVMDQKLIDNMISIPILKKTHKMKQYRQVANGGLGIPNEHYHYWKNIYYRKNIAIQQSLQKFHVKNSTMTDAKLRIIREKWNTALSVKMKQNKKKAVLSAREENQSLLNLIKRIIKDRLFMRKYFNGDFKSKRFDYFDLNHYTNNQQTPSRTVPHKEALKLFSSQLTLEKQIENLKDSEFKNPEIEEIIIGDIAGSTHPTDVFLQHFKECPIYRENIISLVANDFVEPEYLFNYKREFDASEYVAGIFTNFPNLKALLIRGSLGEINPTSVRSAHLSVLILRGEHYCPISGTAISQLLQCEFPQLKHFELWPGYSTNDSINAEHLEELLSPTENGKYPLLEYFGIRGCCSNVASFLQPIANSNLLSRLRILDLSFSHIYPDIRALEFAQSLEEKTRKAFPLLELVDLHNSISYQALDYVTICKIFERLGIVVDINPGIFHKIDEPAYDDW